MISDDAKLSPQEAGFYFPAEWEEQISTILSCPLNQQTWPDNRPAMEKAYAAFAAAVSRYQQVQLLCVAAWQPHWRELLHEAGANDERVTFHDIATDDAWCRDHGPVILKQRQQANRLAISFAYNAWGGKFPPWDQDAQVACKLAEVLDMPCHRVPLVCEGGALETNGRGLLLTTESVLLNDNRNPDMTAANVEESLCQNLGVEQVLWLPDGLCGDDTDGHIDTLTRFFRHDAVLSLYDDDPLSPNHDALKRNFALLQQFRGIDGNRLEVVPLPMPAPVRPAGWREEILPTSYANFLLVNGAVLVPTYQQDKVDQQAIDILQQAFPDREVVPIDCLDLVLEGGALHCLSQQEPAP